jgi:hypothetical protein
MVMPWLIFSTRIGAEKVPMTKRNAGLYAPASSPLPTLSHKRGLENAG